MHYQFTDKDYLSDEFIFQAHVSGEIEGHPFLDPENPPDSGKIGDLWNLDEIDTSESGLDSMDA